MTVTASSSGDVSARFQLPVRAEIQYIDMVVSIYGAISTELVASIGASDTGYDDLTVEQISGDLYRIYGSIYHEAMRFYVRIQATDLVSVTFKSVKISYTALEYYPINAKCLIASTDYNGTINYIPTDTINYRNFLAGNEYLELGYTLYLYSEEWTKYDYIDFTLMLKVQSVISVSCAMGSQIVPMEVSYLANDVSSGEYIVTFRVDCSGLDRSTGDYPQIILSGQLIADAYNLVSVLNVAGILKPSNPSILGSYFTGLQSFLENWYIKFWKLFEGDTSAADDFNQSVTDEVGQLDDGKEQLDKLDKPDLHSAIGNVDVGKGQEGFALVNTVLTSTVSDEYLGFIFTLCVILGIISYLLYGRR